MESCWRGDSGRPGRTGRRRIGERLPSAWIGAVGRRLLGARWFVRDVVIDRWFLHANEPALTSKAAG